MTKSLNPGIVMEGDSILVAGARFPFVLRRSRRARRISLRVKHHDGAVVLVLPQSVSLETGKRFLMQQESWIAAQQRQRPLVSEWAAGVEVPFRGRMHRIATAPAERGRGTVWVEDGCLLVSGRPEYLARRLRDWMIARARDEFTPLALGMAAACGVRVRRVSVRDSRTRWGSCSASGTLSFSWRVIMAPPEILRYLVAHEVAHLKHMDHSERFWRLVAELAGGDANLAAARRWLRENGAALHLQGPGGRRQQPDA